MPACGEQDSFLGRCMWLTCALSGKLGGLGRWKLAHLPGWVVSPHASLMCVFPNTNLQPYHVFQDALEFLPCFGSNLNPRF